MRHQSVARLELQRCSRRKERVVSGKEREPSEMVQADIDQFIGRGSGHGPSLTQTPRLRRRCSPRPNIRWMGRSRRRI